MNAKKLYHSLDLEFETDKVNEDEWDSFDLSDFATESFRKTYKGLVLDNSSEINKVYTAVFPSEPVLDYIIASGAEDTLLFTHHPMIWDSSSGGFPFRNIPTKYLEVLEKKNIPTQRLVSHCLDLQIPRGYHARQIRKHTSHSPRGKNGDRQTYPLLKHAQFHTTLVSGTVVGKSVNST